MKIFLRNLLKLSVNSILISLLFLLQISYAQTWERHVDGFSMWAIGKDYTGNIYAGSSGTPRGIFKSTDGGDTWTNVFSTGASNYLYLACDSLNNIYVANVANGLIYSTDGGQNFTTIPTSTFGGKSVSSVACGRNGHIFVGVTSGGVWRSTDYGATFTNTALQTYSIVEIKVDRFNPDIIYAGSSSTAANGFYISTDDGLTFGASTIVENVWEILQTESNVLYTATTSSPYPFNKSTDGGQTWFSVGNQSGAMRGATLDLAENIYIAGNGGVFKSNDGGATFVNHNLTFSSNKILSFGNKIMACVSGTANGGVWIYTDTSVVPVELISFNAAANNGLIQLNWSTATELNNVGFEIQRSTDGVEFKKIGFASGFGTTTEKHFYSFVDETPSNAVYFYRLKQIDFDGSFEFSKIIEVENNLLLTFSLEQNYPNPFNPSTTVSFVIGQASFVTLKVYDALGEEVATLLDEYKEAGRYNVEFNTTLSNRNLASGIYMYQLRAGDPSTGSGQGFIQTKKLLLMK